MCGDLQHYSDHLAGSGEDEFLLDTPRVRDFIAAVRAAIAASTGPALAIDAIRPTFATLLHDTAWLPDAYQAPVPESGMGGGIGQWLIFRSGGRDLSLFALVVPSGSMTPVHDHLAWGLIGLYKGEQEETVYARRDDTMPVGEREELTLSQRRIVQRGEFYPLLPPVEDIHRVRTLSAESSVSLHLLANDTGCIWRHAFDPETAGVRPFRSGYVNRACGESVVGSR
ncbi:MAG TPA: cysteine dioxygenase family protein [Thermomicrobiales bacterium]|jgi:predicted metal-dependent enzyme (double-stranded beta helix superfamily)